jgi:hypothetical protein
MRGRLPARRANSGASMTGARWWPGRLRLRGGTRGPGEQVRGRYRRRTAPWAAALLGLCALLALRAPVPGGAAERVVYVAPVEGVIDLGLAPFVQPRV